MSLQTVGRYEISGELGRGAMGVVYKAQDPTIGRTVALKTVRVDVQGLESGDVLRRFKNEARAAGLLNHPNIVTIYDAGEQDGLFYIAMEFIEGTTLQELLSQNRVLAPEQAIHISRQICKGLDYAHANGIIHRDIKPANIMITAEGTVKIMDFGIAKAGSGMTSTGQILGTPNYMAPEQVRGKDLDGRSDLFSFAVVLYEIVTGEKPFIGQNITTIIYKIVNENPIAPRDLDVTIHPGLSSVITKALSKSPEDRYQTGEELIRDLENYKDVRSDSDAGSVLPTSVVRQGATTRLIAQSPAPSTAVAAATATSRDSVAMPANAPRRRMQVLALVCVGLIMAAAGGYLLYLYRTTQKIQAADQALEQQLSKQQQEEAALLKAAENKAAPQAASTPSPQATKSQKPVVSPNTIFRNQGELRFDSHPRGAKVSVDGWTEPTWVTPFPASNLGAGQHTVFFSLPGYIAASRTVTVTVGRSVPVSVDLAPAVSKLVVNSTPEGAGIEVDGKDTEKITPAEITLEKGRHTIVLHKAGYSDISTTETLEEGQTLNFAPAMLQPSTDMQANNRPGFLKRIFGARETIPEGKGMVHIHTVPEGATIEVDNRTAPRKTNVAWTVDPGIYNIVLTLDGYKPVRRTIHVQKGRPVFVDEIMEKQQP
jgi:predicted Ser/Thr protein kinase